MRYREKQSLSAGSWFPGSSSAAEQRSGGGWSWLAGCAVQVQVGARDGKP